MTLKRKKKRKRKITQLKRTILNFRKTTFFLQSFSDDFVHSLNVSVRSTHVFDTLELTDCWKTCEKVAPCFNTSHDHMIKFLPLCFEQRVLCDSFQSPMALCTSAAAAAVELLNFMWWSHSLG